MASVTTGAPELKLGIAGLGAIGKAVASAIDGGAVPGLRLAAVCARDRAKAQKAIEGFRSPPRSDRASPAST